MMKFTIEKLAEPAADNVTHRVIGHTLDAPYVQGLGTLEECRDIARAAEKLCSDYEHHAANSTRG